MKDIPILPDKYKGKMLGYAGGNLERQRQWTADEINWCTDLKIKGYTAKEIAKSTNRTVPSVKLKLKRLTKNNKTYNKDHIIEKYLLNREFLKEIKPKTVLDLYAGKKSFYNNYDAITNDIDLSADTNYHIDALKLLCKLYYENKQFDLIDLDPYGSAYDCFDLTIKMAKKGLIITLGELGHKRFNRYDFVGPRYDINKIEDFQINTIIKYIQKIGLRNKKSLEVFKYKEWKNIGRVYFIVKNTKITSQWNKGQYNERV